LSFVAVADDDSTVGDDEDLVAASVDDDLDGRLMTMMKERRDDADVEVDQWLSLMMAPQGLVGRQAMEGD